MYNIYIYISCVGVFGCLCVKKAERERLIKKRHLTAVRLAAAQKSSSSKEETPKISGALAR